MIRVLGRRKENRSVMYDHRWQRHQNVSEPAPMQAMAERLGGLQLLTFNN